MKYKTTKSLTGLYFVSSVITSYRIIFTGDAMAQIPFASLKWLCENKYWKLYAYSLMPNHIHFIVETDRIEEPLAKFHSFTGHEIIKLLKQQDNKELLEFFAASAKAKKRDREHLVWQDSVVRIIETEDVLLDLIEYAHNNPVSKKWRLADSRANYPYSSACYYDKGIQPVIPIADLGAVFGG